MNSLVKLSLFLFLVVGSVGLGSAQSRRSFLITGRAIDDRARPIESVQATISYDRCNGCATDVLPSNASVNGGVFFVETPISLNRRLKLYLVESEPVGFWSPLPSVPSYALNHLAEFRPVWIGRPNGKSRIDLGDVVVRIRYGRVILDLPPNWGNLATEHTYVSLRLIDRTGNVIYSGKLPQAVVNSEHNLLKLALTTGTWQIQVLAELKKAFPLNWRQYIEDWLICERYYFVLLWQRSFDRAQEYATKMVERFTRSGLSPWLWLEHEGDAAFLAQAYREARRFYSEHDRKIYQYKRVVEVF